MDKELLIVNETQCKFTGVVTGVFQVNDFTVHGFETLVHQVMNFDLAHASDIKADVATLGYLPEFPLYVTSEYKVIDGYNRAKAVIELVKEYGKEYYVPFCVTDLQPEKFNSASRGLKSVDIEELFKFSKGDIVGRTGTADRCAQQALGASKLLDAVSGNCSDPFDPTRTQAHYSRIIRKKDIFIPAVLTCATLFGETKEDPAKFTFMHWIAFFCKVPANQLSTMIAKKYLLKNNGHNMQDRLAILRQMLVEYNSMMVCTL